MSQYMEDEELHDLLQMLSDSMSSATWFVRHGSVITISSILRHHPSVVYTSPLLSSIVKHLKDTLKDDKFPIRETATKALGRLILQQNKNEASNGTVQSDLFPFLVSALQDDSSEVRRRALSCVKAIAKENPSETSAYLPILGPALADCLQDGSTPVRLAAERCALHVFQLTRGMENVQAAQKFITGLEARRLSKFPEHSDRSDDSEDELVID